MKRPAAVLWDMDGTLVDSEPYWIECEHELVSEFGGVWTDEDARSVVGFDLTDSAVVLRERGNVSLEPAEIVERLLDGVIARLGTTLPWRPGARELLDSCRREEIPLALVTMSWRRFTDAVVGALPGGCFDVVVAGDEIERGKPFPDPYLAAASALGVDPVNCVAIEDSPTGVAAALAAGCATLGVPHVATLQPAERLTIVDSLCEVTVDQLSALLD